MVEVWDYNSFLSNVFMGRCNLYLNQLQQGQTVTQWYPLKGGNPLHWFTYSTGSPTFAVPKSVYLNTHHVYAHALFVSRFLHGYLVCVSWIVGESLLES